MLIPIFPCCNKFGISDGLSEVGRLSPGAKVRHSSSVYAQAGVAVGLLLSPTLPFDAVVVV